MKTMPRVCISLAGLLLLSACNDNGGSTPSNAAQPNDMTEIVNRAVATSPEDAAPVNVENMAIPAPENAEPRML
jgi:hypothetical protein